jgi:hypothetical protein
MVVGMPLSTMGIEALLLSLENRKGLEFYSPVFSFGIRIAKK